MSLRCAAIEKWWPTTQSLDLVEASIEATAEAVRTEVGRFCVPEPIESEWISLNRLEKGFGLATEFTNVPTLFLVLRTRSKWSVLWNNSFLCDGYDSLCWCLTGNHGLTTCHWCAHDEPTTFQSGASFTFRRRTDSKVLERSVYCGQEDSRWVFEQTGDPLPEESLENYAAHRKKDRLNETLLVELLGRLGAQPWSENFYATGEKACFAIKRAFAPPSVIRRTPQEVLGTRRS